MGRFVHFPAMRYILRWDRIICTFCTITWFNIQAYHSFSTPLCHEHQYFVFRCFEEVEGILILILWYSSFIPHRFLCYCGWDGRGGRDIDGAATEGWTDSIDFSGNYFHEIIVFFFFEYKAYLICLPIQYLQCSEFFGKYHHLLSTFWLRNEKAEKRDFLNFFLDLWGIRSRYLIILSTYLINMYYLWHNWTEEQCKLIYGREYISSAMHLGYR